MLPPIRRLVDFARCALALGPDWRARAAILWRETKNVRVRLGLGAHHPTGVYALRTTCGTLHFRDNFGDITNLPGLFYRQVYGPPVLSPDGVIFDVGANIGLAAAWLAHHHPGRPIYCFEPLVANAALIPLNCPIAQVERVAVGARRGRVALHVDIDEVMASCVPWRPATRPVEFDVVPLDEFIQAIGPTSVALIKIDVEGMEVDVLRGAQETLRRTRRVVIETHSLSLHHEVIDCLRAARFLIRSERFAGATGLVQADREGARSDK